MYWNRINYKYTYNHEWYYQCITAHILHIPTSSVFPKTKLPCICHHVQCQMIIYHHKNNMRSMNRRDICCTAFAISSVIVNILGWLSFEGLFCHSGGFDKMISCDQARWGIEWRGRLSVKHNVYPANVLKLNVLYVHNLLILCYTSNNFRGFWVNTWVKVGNECKFPLRDENQQAFLQLPISQISYDIPRTKQA